MCLDCENQIHNNYCKMSDYLDPANEELLQDFFSEAELQVEMLESNILVLESDPQNSDSIDEIFRAAHTLKGSSATVQMMELAEFTHLVEDSLDAIRSGKVTPDETAVDVLLLSIDVIKSMLEMRRNGEIYQEDTSRIKSELHKILGEDKPELKGTVPAPKNLGEAAGKKPGLSEYELLEIVESGDGFAHLYEVRVDFREDNPMNTVGGIQVYAALKSTGSILKTTPAFDDLYEDVFHPQVVYYVASDSPDEDIAARAEISDVTGAVEIIELNTAKKDESDLKTDKPASKTDEPASEQNTAHAPVQDANLPAIDVERTSAPKQTESRKSVVGSILRVESRRIDDLLNLVSETVINKAAFNQINNEFSENLGTFLNLETEYRNTLRELFDSLPHYLEEIKSGKDPKEVRRAISERFTDLPMFFDSFHGDLKSTVAKFRNTAQNLGRIAGELQEGVMRIRMVTISQIFSRFPRLVRDLSKALKKKIELKIEGEDTELDKSVIEDLLDPLIHCVRNSIDHGIENPSQRKEAGKPEEGTVFLRARNEGNMILIEISDDGKGIDVDAIRTKAIDRGIIHANKQLSDVEAFNLIFDAGFSTAAEITNVSGRGVGLDVVKRQIEKLNGSVAVWSETGQGTRFTIKIPLTLAIIQGLLVRVGKETYAIPITSVIDSHRIKPSDIKMIDNYEVFNVRDDVVSLIRLNRLFRISTNENPDYHYVVIVGSSDKKMGLIVDSLIGEEDVVIKPLRDHYTNSPGIAGANITGDGKVSLIIDVSQLLELGLNREREERSLREMKIGQ